MEGSLVKNNTTGGAEYSRKVFCVLMGYTLWEFDTEADARAGLWPRAEADVIGVSPAPSNSSTLRSTMVSMTSSRSATDAALTFVYTTTAGERVCAVAPSAGECDRWQVALTLGVELLLLTGLAEGAGGAATCVPHEPPQPDASASHCAASGAAFGYTVARHTCAASGRAFAAAHMAPAPLPLPGIGLGHAAKLSDACAQAQQLLNASRCRARLLAAAAHGADLEQTLERKFKADRKPLWLLHKDQLDAPPPAPLLSLDGSAPPPPPANTRDEAAKAACGILLSDAPLSDPEYLALFNTCREAARDAADRSYDAYVAQVLDGMRGDAAALVGELHALTTFPPAPGGRGAPLPPRPRAASAEPSKKEPEELVDRSKTSSALASKGEEKDEGDAVVVQIDDGDAAFARDQDVLRSRLPSSSHGVAVRDVLVALLHVRADDDDLVPLDEEPPPPAQLQTPRPGPVKRTRKGPNLLFYLPQLAHVYYRCLPPRDADAAVRVTLVEEFLLKTSRRSFRFALRLAWMLVAYLEDRGAAPARRPHVLRLLVELEAAAAYASSQGTSGDPWALRRDAISAAAMSRRGPGSGEASPFAGAVALELLPRVPPWLALELRRASSALRRAVAKALATLGVAPAEPVVDLSAPESPGGKAKQYFETDRLGSSSDYDVPPDDVLAREMRFVRAMCDVAEAMRSVEHSNRPARLKKELEALPRRTPLAHSPINATYVVTESGARSLHLGRVARIPPNEGHVFKTKARAPTLMLLETVDDPKAGADAPARAASPSPLVGGSDSDTSDDVVALELLEQTRASERDKELAELLAKQLGDVAPEPEDGEPVSPGTPRGRPALSASAMKRVCSVPSIVDAACGSDDEGPQRDDDGDEPGDRTPPPPRRVASATTLSVLAEGETPREGDDDAASQPEKRSVSPVPPPDFGSESGEAFASEPVASGSRDRAEVVRALRKKPALGLKIERLSSITGPGLGGGGSPEAAESEGQDGAADAPEKPDELLGDVVVVPSPEPEGAAKKKWVPGFGEPWVDKRERIRRSSPIGGEPTWNLVSCIVKSNDDLRQEVCALQIIAACNDAFEAAGLGGDETGLWLRHYSIVPTGASTGIIETMADAVSLDGLKKAKEFTTLKHHFHVAHGGDGSLRHAKARKAFVSSMAAYSLVCHLLGLKDRHNGNILLDSFGHVIHIDFGFLLGQAPGGSFSLERVPFKLTAEHVDAMGGWSSDGFADFVVLLACGFAALQKHASKILHLVEIMAKDSPFPCFKNGPACVDKMRAKLKLHFTTKEQVAHHVAELVRQSYNAYGTRQYDSFQYLTNGIYS